MRILHTADWHLGKRLYQYERTEEHQLFLNWLLQCLQEQRIDVLIVAGDIFDTGSPANEALKLYYNFLVQLRSTGCRQAIIIGGNHDSISTLQAPRQLLKAMQIEVVGGVPDNAVEQIIELKNTHQAVEAVVAAVPFLRDRDVRLSVAGEDATARESRLRQGIIDHYQRLMPLLQSYKTQGLPIIATGHLFAAGAQSSDSEKEIHVGSLGHVPAPLFPAELDYIALGHIHKPQIVGGIPHIRYSGSPIPLSFSEAQDAKQVLVIETSPGQPLQITPVPIPSFRPLLRLSGSPQQVLEQAAALPLPTHTPLPAWVEVQAITNNLVSTLQDELLQVLTPRPGFGQLFLRQQRQQEAAGINTQIQTPYSLAQMTPQEVFTQRLQTLGQTEDLEALHQTFTEALQLMQEEEGAL